MEGREEGDPGYDDWFDEPEPPQGRRTRSVLDDEDAWVLPESGPGRERSRRRDPIVIAGREVGTAQLAIAGACFLAIVLAILAAAGAFSGSSPHTQPVNTATTPPPTVSPAVTTPTVPSTSGSAPTQTLKPGDTGAQVTALQNALTTLGYSPGKADGDYGPSTQLAVEKFQADNNLAVDGVVGPQTLSALQKALSG